MLVLTAYAAFEARAVRASVLNRHAHQTTRRVGRAQGRRSLLRAPATVRTTHGCFIGGRGSEFHHPAVFKQPMVLLTVLRANRVQSELYSPTGMTLPLLRGMPAHGGIDLGLCSRDFTSSTPPSLITLPRRRCCDQTDLGCSRETNAPDYGKWCMGRGATLLLFPRYFGLTSAAEHERR